MRSAWPWSFRSPPTRVIHLNRYQCSKKVTSQRTWVISHCGWSTVLASCLLTRPYKLELRGFPLLRLLAELFPGCPHFPRPGLAAVHNDSALLTCNCLPDFFFFFLRKGISSWFSYIIWFLNNLVDFSNAFGSLNVSQSGDTQTREG